MAILFGHDGWRGELADTFTIRNARIISQAMADDLLERGEGERGVVIGYDTRFLSDKFARECAQVLAANGIPVFLLDTVTPTPMLSFAVRYFGVATGLMVTGGHCLAERNGLKWKGPHAGPISIDEIRQIAKKVGKTPVQRMSFAKAREDGLIRMSNCDDPYFSQVMRFLSPSLSQQNPLHVVVDTMHGAAGAYFAKALEEIGCQVTCLHQEVDPLFGGMEPDPVEENMAELRAKVLEVGADLGLATDGDGDRLAAVDATGRFVSSQMLFSLLTLHLLRERNWTGNVVKTCATTEMVEKVARLNGAQVVEVPVGFAHISECMQQENVLIGGEESGGIGIARHMPERDAVFAALLLIEHLLLTGQKLGTAVDALLREVGEYAFERVDLPVSRKKQELLTKTLRQKQRTFAGRPIAETDTQDGVKYRFADGGWLLFRFSNTEPLLRIYAEGKRGSDVAELLEAACRLVEHDLSRI